MNITRRHFSPLAGRKLDSLRADGHKVVGVALEKVSADNTTRSRAWVSFAGMILWPKTEPEASRPVIELAELQVRHEKLIEDRARFPDRPDGIGQMIQAHIGNLKAGKKSAEEANHRLRIELEATKNELAAMRRKYEPEAAEQTAKPEKLPPGLFDDMPPDSMFC